MRAGTITRYEVDGKPVTATSINAEYPRFYAVRIGNGPVLGHLRRSALSHAIDAYLGSAVPDAMGAQLLGSHETMRAAIERIVQAAISRDIAPETD